VMNIDRIDMEGVTVLRLEGDLDDGDGVEALRVALLDCIREKRYQLVVDLSDTGYLSYMGIGVLVERLRLLHQHGGDMKLSGVNLYTERIFRLSGVSSLLNVCDTEASAIQGLREAVAA